MCHFWYALPPGPGSAYSTGIRIQEAAFYNPDWPSNNCYLFFSFPGGGSAWGGDSLPQLRPPPGAPGLQVREGVGWSSGQCPVCCLPDSPTQLPFKNIHLLRSNLVWDIVALLCVACQNSPKQLPFKNIHFVGQIWCGTLLPFCLWPARTHTNSCHLKIYIF